MKVFRISVMVVASGLGLCIWAAATAQDFSRGRPPSVSASTSARVAAQPASGSDFGGGLVALSVRGSNQPKLLEKARFQDIHGRRFLVGKEAKALFSFPVGTPVHVAWDAVETFYVFENVAQYEQAMRQALEQAQGTVSNVLGDFFPGAKCTVNSGPGFAGPTTNVDSFVAPTEIVPTTELRRPYYPAPTPPIAGSPNEEPHVASGPPPTRIYSRTDAGSR